jgi:hypothetical protein
MNKVRVVTSDGKIWNLPQTYADIIHASQQGPVELDLLTEGPCCQTSGIDAMLDEIVLRFGFDPSLYTIVTSNQLPSSKYQEQRTTWVELNMAKKLAQQTQATESTLEKCFGMFVGRSNWQRLGLASHLWMHHKNQTTMTFHYDPTVDFHRSNFGLEELVTRHWSAWPQVYEFIQHLPICLDKQSYPIVWNDQAFNLNDQYQKFFCEIVCETCFTGKTFFVTEKTLRCIINQRPFLVQGPKGYLRNLHALGFKTFGQWWDEGYDEDPSDSRYQTLCSNIDYIAQQNKKDISQWYQEMKPTLEHNVQVLQQLTDETLLGTEFYHE